MSKITQAVNRPNRGVSGVYQTSGRRNLRRALLAEQRKLDKKLKKK